MFVFKNTLITSMAAILLIGFCGTPVKAAVIINASQSGGSVVFDYSGTINITGLADLGANVNAGGPWVIPSAGVFLATGQTQGYSGSFSLPRFGNGLPNYSGSRSGDVFGMREAVAGTTTILVPSGYSGGSILGSMSFAATDFATLGLTPGSYIAILPNTDTITMNIPVPTPAPLPLLGLGAATAFSRKLKQRIALRRKREEVGAAV